MKKKIVEKAIALIAIPLMALCGCSSGTYCEGTTFHLGALIPDGEEIVGLDICSYLNGVRVNAGTNRAFTVERTHTATNSYFGMVTTQESSHTKIDAR